MGLIEGLTYTFAGFGIGSLITWGVYIKQTFKNR